MNKLLKNDSTPIYYGMKGLPSWLNLNNTGSIDSIVSECPIKLPEGLTTKKSICTCGASKTSNPNLHSDWCDYERKE